MNKIQILFLALFILLLDQVSKFFVIKNIELGSSVPLLPGCFQLTNVTNTGIAFSILEKHPEFLTVLITLIMIFLVFYFLKANDKGIFWSFLIGGGSSNLLDRFFHGYVVDFIEPLFIDFPVFNIADIALNIGVFLLLFNFIKTTFVKESK